VLQVAKGQVAWKLDVALSDEALFDLGQVKRQVETLLSELDH
jgi:hypothetical protein